MYLWRSLPPKAMLIAVSGLKRKGGTRDKAGAGGVRAADAEPMAAAENGEPAERGPAVIRRAARSS
jgi:hypothetical protein